MEEDFRCFWHPNIPVLHSWIPHKQNCCLSSARAKRVLRTNSVNYPGHLHVHINRASSILSTVKTGNSPSPFENLSRNIENLQHILTDFPALQKSVITTSLKLIRKWVVHDNGIAETSSSFRPLALPTQKTKSSSCLYCIGAWNPEPLLTGQFQPGH